MEIFPIPAGTRDMLPPEAEELRYLEVLIRSIFRSFGYGEVITPTLETESALEAAAERRLMKSFRCFDERGDMLVLRPEMTIPIARLVSTRMADRELPLRLSYFANSFRPTEPQRGRQTEFFQAGLELIGVDSPAMDAEVLAVLCQALDACGLDDYAVSLGEASFLRALLDDLSVDVVGREAILGALERRDLVELSDVVAGLELPGDSREAILEVATLRGGSEVLSRARELARGTAMDEALKRLARTYYLLTRYGYADSIIFDMGIFRDFDYYTGLVFEVLCEGIGFPVGGGGRYDGLLARFGRQEPAVGFAIGLDRLHIAVSGQGGIELDPGRSAVLLGGLDEQLEMAALLRGAGINIYSMPLDTEPDVARRIAAENDIPFIIRGSEEGYQLLGPAGGETLKLEPEGLLEAMGC